jgi:hypothetical protein
VGRAGVSGWASDSVREGARYAARNIARGLGGLAKDLQRVLGGAKSTTVRELQGDPSAVRFSEKMFGKSALKLQVQADNMSAAWAAYAEAISNLGATGANLGFAASHVAQVAGNLGKAAALTTSPGATRMAEYGLKLATLAVSAAEKSAPGARELTLLSAHLAGATANVLVSSEVQVPAVKETLASFQAELAELVKQHPGLGSL